MTVVCDDLMAPDVIVDPHSYYRELREADPVHWNERWGGWILTGYDDVVKVLRDHRRFSSDRMAFLARMESQEAFGGLTARLGCPTLATGTLEYHPSVVGRALKSLPIAF